MGFAVRIVPSALDELKEVPVYYRRQIVAAIEEQLIHQPLVATRNRKELPALRTSFEYQPPLWELRVGNYRAFYDVNQEAGVVYVRAVREKPPHATSEEVL